MNQRIAKLRQRLAAEGLDALLVSAPENRRYLSGFTGSAGLLVIPVSGDSLTLATDFRYVEQAGVQAPAFHVQQIAGGWDWAPKLFAELGVHKVGFEAGHLTYDTYQQLVKAVAEGPARDQTSFVPTTSLVEPLRAVKDAEELASLQRAIDISDRALDEVAPTIRPGETEVAVAWRIEQRIRELGAESVSFELIVAAGPNGAMPHHRPSGRPIAAGEPIVMDIGARAGGYCSDLTRTVCVGRPDATYKKVYDTVLAAQLTAIATMRPGMTGKEADALARVVIEQAAHGERFGHGLGHGVGLAIHEQPTVGPRSTTVLEQGMVFTVEPGIYIPGWGGVRIEDVVILQRDGARVLSHARKTDMLPGGRV